MILDKQLFFSDKQTLTAVAVSTNVVDQGAAGDAYDALWFVLNVTTAITGTLGFELQTSTDEAFTSPIKLCTLAAAAHGSTGNVIITRVPKGAKKYLRVNYIGAPTAGAVTAFLAKDISL